jgi:hypothetical protein
MSVTQEKAQAGDQRYKFAAMALYYYLTVLVN